MLLKPTVVAEALTLVQLAGAALENLGSRPRYGPAATSAAPGR